MRKGEKFGWFIFGAVVMGLVLVGYKQVTHRNDPQFCSICARPIHANSRVIIEVDGERRPVCCARCAVTESAQLKRPVKIVQVTDYVTSARLAPEDAWFVDGSRKVLCDHDMSKMDVSKHPQELAFDRCSPGAYAFAHKEDAEKFARDNGGVVLRLAQLMPNSAAPGVRP